MAGRNPNDCRAQIKLCFEGKGIVSQIIGVNLGIAPVAGNRDSASLMPFLYLAARGESFLRPQGNRNDITMAIAVANAIAPTTGLTPLTRDQARSRYRIQFLTWMCNEGNGPNSLTDIAPANYVAALAAGGDLHAYVAELPGTLAGFTNVTLPTLIDLVALSAANVAALESWVIATSSLPRLKQIGTSMYATAWVAFAKRGSLTDNKAQSICAEMKSSGFDNPNITPEVVRTIFSQLGSCVDETTAAATFAAWTTDLGAASLRLRITMQQAALSGLTALIVIKKAYTDFPDFDWNQIAAYVPAEWDAVGGAFTHVNNNAYFGFAADMGVAKSTLYKTISYTAKELLITHGGSQYNSLRYYGGWATRPKYKLEIDNMIAVYAPGGGGIAPAQSQAVRLTALTASCTAATNLILN